MRSTFFLILIALGGCDGLFGIHDSVPRGDASNVGGDGKVFMDAPADARACWATGIPDLCFATPPSGDVPLTGALDTTTDARCSSSFSANCVIAGGKIDVDTLLVNGARPLVLVASDTLTVTGKLDVASHVSTPAKSGPGAVAATCHPFGQPVPDKNGTNGTGGGAGGSYGNTGGAGGGNDSGAHGGATSTAVDGNRFAAGCRGEDGASANPGPPMIYGLGGAGGGAAYLVGGNAITIAGVVNASGAGGFGGECVTPCNNSADGEAHGGGGGGAGGMIVLEAPSIANTGSIFADGGGGGEGASHSTSGASGQDPLGATAALGGSAEGSHHGGPGGAGGHGAAVVGAGGVGTTEYSGGGGGGGGGGVGKIVVYGGGTLTGNVSPTPMP